MELWKTNGVPKYWTALYFTSSNRNLPSEFASILKDHRESSENWYVDFKHENVKYIVFKNRILRYTIGNQVEKDNVARECKKLGIQSIDEIEE